MISSELPQYPWQKIGVDLFHKGNRLSGSGRLFFKVPRSVQHSTVQHHSRLSPETLKSSQFGIPEIVFSDNGPQVTSDQFAEAGPRMAAQESMQNAGAGESAGAPTGQ